MGMFIKEMLDPTTLDTLTSNASPQMIRQENVAQATKQFLKAIKLIELYPSYQALIDRFEPLSEKYPAIHAHRTLYLWKMVQALYQTSSLNLSDGDFLQSNILKCQISFINVLLDDICDLGRDKTMFDQCILALEGKMDSDETGLYQLIADTWSVFQRAIEQTPNYALLKPVLEEAYQRWIASFEYSFFIQQEAFRFEQTWKSHLETMSHSTCLYLAGLIDLLFVPNLAAHQISSAAKIFLGAQEMAQIANWATTWERELPHRDFTSGIFNIALENHWIESDDLKNGSLEKIREQIRNSPAEGYLWNEWDRLRVESLELAREIHLPALDGYVDSLSVMMFILYASTGLV